MALKQTHLGLENTDPTLVTFTTGRREICIYAEFLKLLKRFFFNPSLKLVEEKEDSQRPGTPLFATKYTLKVSLVFKSEGGRLLEDILFHGVLYDLEQKQSKKIAIGSLTNILMTEGNFIK